MNLVEFNVFQGSSKKWYITCPKRVAKIENQWYYPARRLNMELDKYIQMLVEDFHIDYVNYYEDNNFLYFYWNEEHYAFANKFKLWLNKKAREGKWMY